MKKSLFALVVLGAFAGAASAQTSVTVYGVADLGLSKASGTSAQMTGSGMMNNGSSRIGFRGVEDLGGGLKASFTFEQQINMENGAEQVGAAWQRGANMALSGNWGSFSMGRGLNTGFFGVAAYELTGAANYSVLFNQFGFAGGAPRYSSEFRYTTPNFNGFTAAVGHVLKQDLGAADGQTGINLIYKGGPISAGLTYDDLSAGGGDVSLGGAYNFGAFKVAASYIDFDSSGAKGFTLGGGTTMGPVSLVLDIARRTDTGFKNTDYLIEAKYSLSKRTTTYAAFHREGTASTNSFGVGVRHNF